jgi:predicted Ser/Thr protein kinase
LHISPTSSPYPTAIRKPSKSFIELEEGNMVSIYPRHIRVAQYISHGTDGKVFSGCFYDRPCVIKFFDIFQRPELESKAQSEVDMLKTLHKQGIAPQLFGFGNLSDLMSLIAMEEGEEVKWENTDSFKTTVIKLYQMLHALNILHNDVEQRHILRFRDGLKLVDFANATRSTCPLEKDNEMKLVYGLFESE